MSMTIACNESRNTKNPFCCCYSIQPDLTSLPHIATVFVSFITFLLIFASGCAGRGTVQDNPAAHQKIVFASAYSTADCQAKMNALAQSDVTMIHEALHSGTSVLSLGIVPSHQCIGIAKDNAAPMSSIPNHE
ncbi:MAG: hypothetical protein HY269_04075 [Deltaproteobacteria bacterium]|nr:hypothetical protein [Deltaproteobacteria bacterium]